MGGQSVKRRKRKVVHGYEYHRSGVVLRIGVGDGVAAVGVYDGVGGCAIVCDPDDLKELGDACYRIARELED